MPALCSAAGNADVERPRTASNGTVSSVSTEEAGTPRPLSPSLHDIDVKFDTVYSYEVIEIDRKQQAYSRFVEVCHHLPRWQLFLIPRALQVKGDQLLTILNETGNEVARHDLTGLTNLSHGPAKGKVGSKAFS